MQQQKIEEKNFISLLLTSKQRNNIATQLVYSFKYYLYYEFFTIFNIEFYKDFYNHKCIIYKKI